VDAEEDCLISYTANAVAIQVYKDDFQIEKNSNVDIKWSIIVVS